MRYIIPILLIVVFGCRNNEASENMSQMSIADAGIEVNMESKEMDYKSSEDAEPSESELVLDERKLIKTGDYAFETTDRPQVQTLIMQSIQKYGAYVAADNEYRTENRISRSMTIRIPAENFDGFISSLEGSIEYFDRKNVNVQDVSEEFLDVEARLKTKKELEQRYIDLLKKANKVSEILEIEREIGNLRTSIESIEGRLKYLKSQVGYSTLNINYYEVLKSDSRFGLKLKQGFTSGWAYFVSFILGLVNIWPFLLIVLIGAIFLVRRWRRKRS